MKNFNYTRFAVVVVMAVLASTAVGESEFFTPKKDLDGLEQDREIKAGLPTVLILGDSISIGYTPTVIELLKEIANVQRPKANCGSTESGLKHLDAWLGDAKWDVIHFNWGLHDLCYRHPHSKEQGHRDKVNGKVSVPLAKYEKNLEALVVRLEQTGATLIWANTTPIPPGEVGRVVGDELTYNAVAETIMKQHGIAINELHGTAAGFDPSLWEGPGNVHFAKDGSALLGKQVAASIKSHLRVEQGAERAAVSR